MTKMKDVVISNYMPYAAGTIMNRAIPMIDGLKPANRRILYTMYEMGLLKADPKKSAKVAGQVMSYHPHGDGSIYETIVRMTDGYRAMNLPFIKAKGSMGKAYSTSLPPAAPRYTSVALMDICKELFDGIKENAVDMVPNFDDTETEPAMLPVKFPTILANASSGIAVSIASSIPAFNLKKLCKATKLVVENGEVDRAEFVDTLGYPDFVERGFIHKDDRQLARLALEGKGSFSLSGKVEIRRQQIDIVELPYRVTTESVVNKIIELRKTDFKEVTDVKDLTDKSGMRVRISLKASADPRDVIRKLYRFTGLRTKVGFNCVVIVDGKCEHLGTYQIIQKWVEFRLVTVQRIYTDRLKRMSAEMHLIEAWEKICDRLGEFVDILKDNSEETAKKLITDKFGLDVAQADYLMDLRLRVITKDRAIKELQKLEKMRNNVAAVKLISESEAAARKLISKELDEISEEYGKTSTDCEMAPEIVEDDTKEEVEEIDDTLVIVYVTEKGYIKRLTTNRDIANFEESPSDKVKWRFSIRNNESLLVFTYSGYCYKIPVHLIDSSKGIPKEYIYSHIEKQDDSEILYITKSGPDYSGSFNVVYNNGKGAVVYLDKVSGNRSKYKGLFDAGEPANKEKKTPATLWVTEQDKFFIITAKRRAAFGSVGIYKMAPRRTSFKVARISRDDTVIGIQPVSEVPDFEEQFKDKEELVKYAKGYCVMIKHELWRNNSKA